MQSFRSCEFEPVRAFAFESVQHSTLPCLTATNNKIVATTHHAGKSFPVVVMVNLPCFTPFALINRSAIRWISDGLPRTTKTSRQL